MSVVQKNLPYFAEGKVVSGFGRGSRELGIPTANFPEEVIRNLPSTFECGVYYGWAKISSDDNMYKMVMCVGWNPYYHNTVKTMETHLIHKFDHDFYGDQLKVVVLGYIRPMRDFESLDALIQAIHNDIAEANKCLQDPTCLSYRYHAFFSMPSAPFPSVADINGSSSGFMPDQAKKPCCNEDSLANKNMLHGNYINNSHKQNGILQGDHHDASNSNKYAVKYGSKDKRSCEEEEDFDVKILPALNGNINSFVKEESCSKDEKVSPKPSKVIDQNTKTTPNSLSQTGNSIHRF